MVNISLLFDLVQRIMAACNNPQKQSILCSATTSVPIDKIVKQLLKKDYVFISTVPPGESNVHEKVILCNPLLKVPQFHYEAQFCDQLGVLVSLMEQQSSGTFKAVVFCPTAHLANLYHAGIEWVSM